MPISESHPVLIIPKENLTLWRYMDIPSFLSLILNESLTFVRADLFEDRFEGTLPRLTAELLDYQMQQKIKNGELDQKYLNLSSMLNQGNKTTYLNCWCKENHEMVHMWKIYSKENGLAIQTDYNRLKESILTDESIHPTEIRYLDYNNVFVDWKFNTMTFYTLKRNEYKSENEFRLILSHPRFVENQIDFKKSAPEIVNSRNRLYEKTPVIKCRINPAILISKIYISPYAPKWYYEMVSDILEKFNLADKEIIQSEL